MRTDLMTVGEIHDRCKSDKEQDMSPSPCDSCEAYKGIAHDFEESKSCLRDAYEKFSGFVNLETRRQWERVIGMKPSKATDHVILDSELDVYRRLKRDIADLQKRVLRRVVLKAKGLFTCLTCGKSITRHAAQTEDGNYHHLGCITKVPSPHYMAEDDRVFSERWKCGCGHHNAPNTRTCVVCGKRPGPCYDLTKNQCALERQVAGLMEKQS